MIDNLLHKFNKVMFKKTIKIFVLAIFLVLIFNNIYSVALQNANSYATVGDFNVTIRPQRIRVYNEQNFKIGLQWAVFSLEKNQYLGTAKVIRNHCDSLKKCSELIPSKKYSTENEDLLLLRPIPKYPNKVKIKSVSCHQLPTALQKEIYKKIPSHLFKLNGNREEGFIINLDSDAYPDILKIKLIDYHSHSGYNYLFVRNEKKWLVKYKYEWGWN